MTAQRTAETQITGAMADVDPIVVSGFAMDLSRLSANERQRSLLAFSYILRNLDVLEEVTVEAERLVKEEAAGILGC